MLESNTTNNTKNIDFENLITVYRKNVYFSMVEHLAKELNVSPKSIQRLNPGFYPLESSWIFPMYDDCGKIIGLQRRFPNGKKYMVDGSDCGLFYERIGTINQKGYQQKNNFVRVNNDNKCPICEKPDWCLISDDNLKDPSCVICGRVEEGSEKYIQDAGFLHRRKENYESVNGPVLPESDKPYLIVEGVSDVLTAMDLGYAAIGKANALSGHSYLSSLLNGRQVLVFGENDKPDPKTGIIPGHRGMERTFQVLKAHSTSIRKCLPPSKFKDLRAWSPTIQEFEAWIREHAVSSDPDKIVPTTQATFLVDKFLSARYMTGEQRLLHSVHRDFYKWTGKYYEKVEQDELEGELYDFFDTIEVRKKDKKDLEIVVPLKVNRNFIEDILRRLKSRCYIKISDDISEPFFINGEKPTNAERIIPFNNGLYLDVETDEIKAIGPNLFITSTLECPYDPVAKCPLWEGVINMNFNGNQECIDLLAEWFGYCLLPTNYLQSMMLFTGKPRSGKSTTKNILEKLLGKAKFFAIDSHNFTDRFGTSDLKDRHLATISEQEAIGKYNADRMFQKLKTITGADSIRIEEKYKKAYNVKLFSRFLLVLNDLPKFDDAAGALPPRLNLLWFNNNYEELGRIDRHLENKLVTELPGVALWAIKGLKRLLEDEKFTRPQESEHHLKQLENLSNPLLSMVNECCDVYKGTDAEDHYIPTDGLFEFHKTWYSYCNEKELKREEFGRRLRAIFPHIENVERRIAGERKRIYVGIEFKPAKLQEYEVNKSNK